MEAQQRAADGEQAFEPNAFYEKLIQMRETNARAFDGLAPASKLTLSYYEAGKRRHAMLNNEVTN